MRPQLIVALDNLTIQESFLIVKDLKSIGIKWFKVGLELYSKTGPLFIEKLIAKDLHVFVDLKLYDIPNTVIKATRAIADLGADLLTVHCSGGIEMMRAAHEGATKSKLKIIGVTVLTSLGKEEGFSKYKRTKTVFHLAKNAAYAGLDGIVCSVPDLKSGFLKKIKWQKPLFLVTPGIRNHNYNDDQKSIGTVQDAVIVGATHLVVGRPITQSQSGTPIQSAKFFVHEIERCLLG